MTVTTSPPLPGVLVVSGGGGAGVGVGGGVVVEGVVGVGIEDVVIIGEEDIEVRGGDEVVDGVDVVTLVRVCVTTERQKSARHSNLRGRV